MHQCPFSPATERNKEAILGVLRRVLPKNAEVLEIGSGNGRHALYFCRDLGSLSWQPTEPEENVGPLAQGLQRAPDNLRAPLAINVKDARWPVGSFDVVFTANTLHIMCWQAVVAFFCGVGRHLRPGGIAVIYGPFKYNGGHTADSNRAFDLELRRKAPQMGIRDVAELAVLASAAGLALHDDIDMPVNNRVLVFKRTGEPENE